MFSSLTTCLQVSTVTEWSAESDRQRESGAQRHAFPQLLRRSEKHVQLKSGVQAGTLYVKQERNNTRMSCEPGKNDATLPTPQENTAVGKTADSGSIMASFYDLKLKCRRPVMWLSPHVQPGRSVHVRMRFFKLNSHNLHKPEHSDSRGSSEATADAPGSLKLEGNVRNLQLMFKLICRQIDCPVITAEKV